MSQRFWGDVMHHGGGASAVALSESGFQGRLAKELKPIGVRSQLYGIISWFVAYALMNSTYQPDLLWSACAIVVAFAGLAITRSSTSHHQFTLGGTLQIAGLAWAFRVIENAAPNTAFWIMQSYGTMVLIKSVMYVSTPAHIVSCVIVGLILGVGSFTEQQIQAEAGWIALGFGSPFLFSVLLNKAFLALRRRNMELNLTLHEMAYKDPLTGINNRRSLLENAEKLEQSGPGYFMMVDLDDFKKINDDFGHDVGDHVLKEVAAVLGRCPHAALVGRMGGEEFAVVCAGACRQNAAECAGWIVAEVNSLCHEKRLISVSIGISQLDSATGLNKAMKFADEALYRAKAAGKNCYVFYDEAKDAEPHCLSPDILAEVPAPVAREPHKDRRGQR